MTVLLVTRSDDTHCAPRVERAIAARGGRSVRLDSDRFPAEVLLQGAIGSGEAALRGPFGRLPLAEVSAVWLRRFAPGESLPRDLAPEHRAICAQEARRALEGALGAIAAPQVDPLEVHRRGANKQLQLELARRCGLRVPRTMIGNDPEGVRALAAACPEGLVTKMLSSVTLGEGAAEATVFTSELGPADLEAIEGVRWCPMIFQELVPKRRELRVTAVGRTLLAAAVDSQASPASALDWRRDGVGLLRAWERATLPADTAAALQRLLDALGLNYGAADLIETPEGELVFLEVNPGGEYFWLEDHPGLPVSDALAALLLGQAERRCAP